MTKSLICAFLILTTVELVYAGWREPIRAEHGMVVTAEKQATRIGMSILQQGGNAVDAAVAVGFALAVTYPQAGNIGGGGFMVIRTFDGARFTLDYREKAPGGADRNMYLDEQGNVVEDASIVGYLASGVPGSVAGLYRAHKRFGKLPWKNLVQPAIDLARSGFHTGICSAGFQLRLLFSPGTERHTRKATPSLNQTWLPR